MTPFVAKPGETITGLGLDFSAYLADDETISDVTAAASNAGLTVSGAGSSGTIAVAHVAVAANLADGEYRIDYTVTGSAGSVRKSYRRILVAAGAV
jgi:hypothetical protein